MSEAAKPLDTPCYTTLSDDEVANTMLSREYTGPLEENDQAGARWLLADRVSRMLAGAELASDLVKLRANLLNEAQGVLLRGLVQPA